MQFRRKQLVRHVKTGAVYRIVHTPSTPCVLEANTAFAYAYKLVHTKEGDRMPGACLWVRSAFEMEDGRFEPVE